MQHQKTVARPSPGSLLYVQTEQIIDTMNRSTAELVNIERRINQGNSLASHYKEHTEFFFHQDDKCSYPHSKYTAIYICVGFKLRVKHYGFQVFKNMPPHLWPQLQTLFYNFKNRVRLSKLNILKSPNFSKGLECFNHMDGMEYQ